MDKTCFDAAKAARHITDWTRNWFKKNKPGAQAVIGISGGKDSTIAAAILARALGPDRVMGVLMPDAVQPDLDDAKRVVQVLGINAQLINIGDTTSALTQSIFNAKTLNGKSLPVNPGTVVSRDAAINIPPRVRMATLYAVAQTLSESGYVCNTCNLSEDYIGYSTKYGDAAGDFAPLAEYTVTEVLAIGHALELPHGLVYKTPSDGLCGQSDEDRFGFKYAELDEFIRTGISHSPETKAKIIAMHAASEHKRRLIPACPYNIAA